MIRALATVVNSEPFMNTSEFNQQEKKTFDAPLSSINKNPVINDATPLGSVDPTTRQMTMRDPKLLNYLTNTSISPKLLNAQAKCKTASLDSLIQSQSITSAVRCGWIYKKGSLGDAPAVSSGFLGQRSGPETFFSQKPPPGKWYWNLDNAKKDMMKDRCAALTSCENVGAENYKGCAYSTTLGSGVPVNSKGTMLYPNDPTASAPPSSLVLTANKCPPPPPPGSPAYELARSRDVCMPMENGRLSRDCMLQQLTAAGCKQDGTLYDSLVNEAQPNNYAAGLQNTTSFKKYQQLSKMPLLDGVVQTGSATSWLALYNFQQLAVQSAIVTKDPLNTAARDLCLEKGLMDSYDFCNDLKDTTPGPFRLECFQKAWIREGGTSQGTEYPTKSNNLVAVWNGYYKTWGHFLKDIRQAVANTRSSDEKIQTIYLQTVMGIKREVVKGVQIARMNGTEVFWFNSANNTFIGRRLSLTNPQLPWFGTGGEVDKTGSYDRIEYYSLTNLRPPSTMDIALSFGTDDGSVYALNKNIDGKRTRGQWFNDETMFGANWDQAPTQYYGVKLWRLQANGPNYFNAFWQETGGYALSALQYRKSDSLKWGQVPSEWQTLTQEPNAPMLSWEGMKNYGFVERRFPSVMELVMTGGYSMVRNPSSTLKYPSVLKLKASGNGSSGQVKRNISMNSWRTLTCSFLVNSSSKGNILRIGNYLVMLQVGTSVRVIWSSATLKVDTTFENILTANGTTPHYIIVNMRSAYDSKYPNELYLYVKKFGPIDQFSIKKFTTVQNDPLYNQSDSEKITLGNSGDGTADISIGSFRLFDYELNAEQFAMDQANTWKMKYIQDTD